MNVREAHAGDTDGIAKLVRESLAGRESRDRARYQLTGDAIREYKLWYGRACEDPRSIVLLAEEGGTIAGFLIGVVCRELPIYELGEYASIQEMWVAPGDESEAVGRGLVLEAAALFGKMGIRQLRAELPAADAALRTVLESGGFRVCAVHLLLEIMPPAARRKSAPRKNGAS